MHDLCKNHQAGDSQQMTSQSKVILPSKYLWLQTVFYMWDAYWTKESQQGYSTNAVSPTLPSDFYSQQVVIDRLQVLIPDTKLEENLGLKDLHCKVIPLRLESRQNANNRRKVHDPKDGQFLRTASMTSMNDTHVVFILFPNATPVEYAVKTMFLLPWHFAGMLSK